MPQQLITSLLISTLGPRKANTIADEMSVRLREVGRGTKLPLSLSTYIYIYITSSCSGCKRGGRGGGVAGCGLSLGHDSACALPSSAQGSLPCTAALL